MRQATFLRQVRVVFWKEVKDSARDRRAILAIVFGVLVGPAVIAFMVDRLADRERQAEQVRIPIVGAEYAPAFVDWLRIQTGVEIAPGPTDPERSVRDGVDVHPEVMIPLACHWKELEVQQSALETEGAKVMVRRYFGFDACCTTTFSGGSTSAKTPSFG